MVVQLLQNKDVSQLWKAESPTDKNLSPTRLIYFYRANKTKSMINLREKSSLKTGMASARQVKNINIHLLRVSYI